MGREKNWRTKTAISQKRVKIEEKLLWSAYRKSSTFFRTIPDPLRPPLPQDWGSPPPQTSIAIILYTGKVTDFVFGRYIYTVHPSKSPLKTFEKRDRGCIQGLPNFWGYPLLSQERVKPRTSNSADTLTGSIRAKAH